MFIWHIWPFQAYNLFMKFWKAFGVLLLLLGWVGEVCYLVQSPEKNVFAFVFPTNHYHPWLKPSANLFLMSDCPCVLSTNLKTKVIWNLNVWLHEWKIDAAASLSGCLVIIHEWMRPLGFQFCKVSVVFVLQQCNCSVSVLFVIVFIVIYYYFVIIV